MGQHTWFQKDKARFVRREELYERLSKFEDDMIYPDDIEVSQITEEINEISKENYAEYHDVFRTGKRETDKSYINDVIFSREECFNWINDPINKVSFKNTAFDDARQEKINKKAAIKLLNEFWDKYPNGVIYFG